MSAARKLQQINLSRAERMDALPTLPHDSQQRLELAWEELQGDFCFTGTAQAKQTAELAVALFDQIAGEYWNIWKASGEPFGVFRQWLDSIKSLVLTEVEGFWETLKADWGEPERGIRNDCNWPAVKDALSRTIGHWRREAARLARLEPGYPASGDKSLNHWGEWAFRLSSDPSIETGDCPVNGDIRRVNVPDSAIEENNPADPKAKAIENENSRHSHERRHSSLEPAEYRPGRMPVSVGSSDAVRKMDEHIEEKLMTLTQFAGLVPTSDSTLRKFRRTGKVRRDIFGRIATLMGVTPEALAKED